MKYVYQFSEGNAGMRELLGGKGANLAEMTNIGLPVPQGFTVTTEACTRYYEDGEQIAPEIIDEIFLHLHETELATGKVFGDEKNPLMVSVRSGARISMPGMMDTILNLGINDVVVESLARESGNPRWAYDSYRRFITMFADVAMGFDRMEYEGIMDEVKARRGVTQDAGLTQEDMAELVERYKALYKKQSGEEFPQQPEEQLLAAIRAVFRSWNNPRAEAYRRMNDIPGDWGTAVNVQTMVFGNMGETSGTGVAFTRDPATGRNALFGEFLMNAQGEDVVAGIRTPQPISQLREVNPEAYAQFEEIAKGLEKHYKDMQDMEFTIERGKLYMLQTRNGKRTAQAALKIAVDMVDEGLCTREEAILRIEPKQLDALLHPRFDETALKAAEPAAKGLAASPGAGCGGICFTAEDAREQAQHGPVVLVRLETSPEDIEGMAAAQGILTARGGMTSHAAVVARGMGRCCVAGCAGITVDEKGGALTIGGRTLHRGDFISIDGSTGNVYIGSIPTVDAAVTGEFAKVMEWADELRRLGPRDAETALKFGAEGIGLTRTEHMFFADDRIPAVREMIVSKTGEQRRAALEKILPMQRSDFEGIFRVMGERPVTIRLLDPPLHEFLPTDDRDIKALAEDMGITFGELKATVASLHETNPMMGLRGCRLPILYPEIGEMQVRAIIEAAINVSRETGLTIKPEIMVPLVSSGGEIKFMRELVSRVADDVIEQSGTKVEYKVGTMIELPRAACSADRIAKYADFFSFGTNDLTQMSFGLSRDDAGKFLPTYLKKHILEHDPFSRFDEQGTGRLVQMAEKLGHETKPGLHMGVCGEQGGDPESINFFHKAGLDYVSCSPFRLPIARLAAAQAAVRNK